jgi:Undecaprenyl-phosphate glucose phosphotransferase
MLLGDLAVIASCWLVAYGVRFLGPWAVAGEAAAPFQPYLWMLGPILLIWAMAFRVFDLYRPRRISTRSREVWDIAKAATVAVLILMAVSFLYRDFSFSRRVFFLFWIMQILALSVMRALFREVLRSMRKRNLNLRYGLVMGTGETARKLIEVLRSQMDLGVRILGLVGEDPALVGTDIAGVPVVGVYEEVAAVMARKPVDIVFIALPLHSGHRLESILEEIGDAMVDIKVIPDFYRYVTLRGSIEEFQGMPVVSLRDTPFHGWNRLAKRVLDLAVSSLALFLTWPVLALIALAIKVSSPGPILYRQERMGYGGTTFTMLKFRTMRSDHEGDTVLLTSQDDPRVTPIGRLLRRASLDELPQLWNVFCGEMSIVGPRPERPWVVNELRKRIPGYMLKHHIQAGITGWAQVNGWRGDTSVEKRLEFDLYYIEHWSLWFDLKIMFMTLWRGFIHRHAY